MKLNIFAARANKLLADNAPALLTGVGVIGALAASYLTARGTFKAADLLTEEVERRYRQGEDPLNFDTKAKVLTIWKEYIPAAGVLGLSVTCMVCANRISTSRAAALAAAYSLNNKAFTEYREKVVKTFNPTKEKNIRDAIAQDQVNAHPISGSTVVITGYGDVTCYDVPNQRYFKCNMEKIRQVQNDINAQVIENGYASLSDMYVCLKLPTTAMSEQIGWTTDALLDIQFATVLSEDQQPCISMNYTFNPLREYNHPEFL